MEKIVTRRQFECLYKIACEKKISRGSLQQAIDDGKAGEWLDSLSYIPISGVRIAELTKLATDVGARIHVLRRVRVQQDRDWQEAINLAGPNTPMDYNVRKPEVSTKYQPVSQKMVEKDIVLLNYPNGGNWDKAITWGKETKLKAENPREVFAIGEQHRNLHNTLGQNQMYVVAPMECSFDGNRSACDVWWDDSDRRADLDWVSNFDDADGWFAFSE